MSRGENESGRPGQTAGVLSDRLCSAIADSIRDGVIAIDAEGRVTLVNSAAAAMLQEQADDLLGRTAHEVVHGRNPGGADHPSEACVLLAGVAVERHQDIFVRKDGSAFPVSCASTPILDGEKAVGTVFAFTDLSEQQHLLERAVRAERTAILGHIADGILITDAEGTVIFANDAAKALVGREVQGVRLAEYGSAFGASDEDGTPLPAERFALGRAVLYGETTVAMERHVLRPDGSKRVVRGSAAPVVTEDGEQTGAVLTFQDITAEYEAAQQKDDFLSAAAHDLKTPLTSLRGFAQILLRRAQRAEALESGKVIPDLERIVNLATRMSNLITELLDVTRLDMGRPLDLLQRPLDLVGLVRDIVTDFDDDDARRIDFVCDLPELVGLWDTVRIERVVTNLVSNALKFSPARSPVLISIAREDDGGSWAVIRVQDKGIGIPAADLPLIFERFHRARNTAGTVQGTGIGLAGVKQIIEQHGGDIRVESAEGVGSTFTVRLPIEAPQFELISSPSTV